MPKKIENVPEDKAFWLCDGRVLRNLNDLSEALKNMDKGVFDHHVNNEKNDFSSWIRDVVGDDRLAKGLMKIKTVKGTLKKISTKI